MHDVPFASKEVCDARMKGKKEVDEQRKRWEIEQLVKQINLGNANLDDWEAFKISRSEGVQMENERMKTQKKLDDQLKRQQVEQLEEQLDDLKPFNFPVHTQKDENAQTGELDQMADEDKDENDEYGGHYGYMSVAFASECDHELARVPFLAPLKQTSESVPKNVDDISDLVEDDDEDVSVPLGRDFIEDEDEYDEYEAMLDFRDLLDACESMCLLVHTENLVVLVL